MNWLQISTNKKREVIDITHVVRDAVPSGNGLLTVLVRHTTAGITTMDLDPGTDLDFLDFLNLLVPHIKWRHLHNPSHAPDHLLASLIGPSLSLPYENGTLVLGDWQRIVLVECNGPRECSLIIHTISNSV